MEKTYKRVPFDIELAKKIQSGEVEGRIVDDSGHIIQLLRFDINNIYNILALSKAPHGAEYPLLFNNKGEGVWEGYGKTEKTKLFIELPEEAPKHEFKPFDKVLVRENNSQVWHCDFFAYTDSVHNIHYCVAHSGCQILPYKGNEHLVGTTDKPK